MVIVEQSPMYIMFQKVEQMQVDLEVQLTVRLRQLNMQLEI